MICLVDQSAFKNVKVIWSCQNISNKFFQILFNNLNLYRIFWPQNNISKENFQLQFST